MIPKRSLTLCRRWNAHKLDVVAREVACKRAEWFACWSKPYRLETHIRSFVLVEQPPGHHCDDSVLLRSRSWRESDVWSRRLWALVVKNLCDGCYNNSLVFQVSCQCKCPVCLPILESDESWVSCCWLYCFFPTEKFIVCTRTWTSPCTICRRKTLSLQLIGASAVSQTGQSYERYRYMQFCQGWYEF